MDNQFYPTPETLAYRAKTKFKNQKITRLLDPSAGRGALIQPFITSRHTRTDNIDCIEIDFNNQAILRSKGFNVIDGDFLQFNGASMYSHIILNPPFNQGVEHVIKAFDLLINGELVAIINAETLRNPYTKARQFLTRLIDDYGDVEYIESAFTNPDTQRKTNVEVALIWIEKKADIKQTFTHNLEIDKTNNIDNEEKQELAIKQSTISNAVIIFNAAVESLKKAEISKEEANYYAELLGKPLNEMNQPLDITPNELQKRFNQGYDDLKKRAWTNVLSSTEFNKYLSSKAYNKLVADFDAVSKLSFTEANVRGFLLGLINSQAEMNMQMVLDCFDEITKYKPGNRAYYRGWKSNQKHKEQAYRVQMTRFIIPVSGYNYSHSISWETNKKLEDFDKVFAMLDGKAECETSLTWLFSSKYTELRAGNRLSTSYFDVRYYSGAGTIHFFPTKKAVIDRLNRVVGKERQWLPQDDEKAPQEFWKQYDHAEEITRKMIIPATRWGHINEEKLPEAHQNACDELGYDIGLLLPQYTT